MFKMWFNILSLLPLKVQLVHPNLLNPIINLQAIFHLHLHHPYGIVTFKVLPLHLIPTQTPQILMTLMIRLILVNLLCNNPPLHKLSPLKISLFHKINLIKVLKISIYKPLMEHKIPFQILNLHMHNKVPHVHPLKIYND